MFLKLIGFLPNRIPTPFEHPIITLTKKYSVKLFSINTNYIYRISQTVYKNYLP